mmetsp:Transcript_61713/g.198868  ORF Transcript_61713/g.198868 Transcript_61713/m.198868 type:complete len:202 (+) Transcript_61713:322-927(+)
MATAHLHKGEELNDAPKPAQVRLPAQHQQASAAAEEDGQAAQVRLEVALVYAVLVEPDERLAPVLLLEGDPPGLQDAPLCRGAVVPGVRDKGVALSQAHRHGFFQQVRLGPLPRGREEHLLEVHALDGDAAEAVLCLLQHRLRRVLAHEAGDARGRGGHVGPAEPRVHGLPDGGGPGDHEGHDVRHQEVVLGGAAEPHEAH